MWGFRTDRGETQSRGSGQQYFVTRRTVCCGIFCSSNALREAARSFLQWPLLNSWLKPRLESLSRTTSSSLVWFHPFSANPNTPLKTPQLTNLPTQRRIGKSEITEGGNLVSCLGIVSRCRSEPAHQPRSSWEHGRGRHIDESPLFVIRFRLDLGSSAILLTGPSTRKAAELCAPGKPIPAPWAPCI